MRWRRNQLPGVNDSAVVNEARAVLEGVARTTTYAGRRTPPAWVYVNELAHGDTATLARLADRGPALHPATWDHASAVLAGELLARAARTGTLADVQRALVPLELDLLGGACPPILAPARLVPPSAPSMRIIELRRLLRRKSRRAYGAVPSALS